jgi:hypothetical protein
VERARVLKVGGGLLALLIAGLVIGFLVIRTDDRTAPSSPSLTRSPRPSPISTRVQEQVEQAYLNAWDVWGKSLLDLDPSGLDAVLTGQALEVITEQVEVQRQKNQPVRISVEHDYRIVVINSTTVSIEDRFINHNVRLDPETLEPIEDDPNQRERTSFTMRLVDGIWKIAEIIEYESS